MWILKNLKIHFKTQNPAAFRKLVLSKISTSQILTVCYNMINWNFVWKDFWYGTVDCQDPKCLWVELSGIDKLTTVGSLPTSLKFGQNLSGFLFYESSQNRNPDRS